MIMTKDKARELKTRHFGGLDSSREMVMPENGVYHLSSTHSTETIRKLAATDEADFFLTGMVIPAGKAAAICQLLQDDHGFMPSPVIALRMERSPTRRTPELPATDRGVAAVLTPCVGHDQPVTQIKDLEIIPGRHEVRVKGRVVNLTFSEFRILQTLASRPGWVYDRATIIHAVHGDGYNCTERAVDVQVTGLRKKLGPAGDYIQTVRGIGYRFIG